jgi:hypothetical protein
MCSVIADVALMVCAGPHSVAGAYTADRLDGSSAAGGRRRSRQPTTNASGPCRVACLSWDPPRYAARARARARWTCAQRWCTRVCVIGVGNDTCTGMW